MLCQFGKYLHVMVRRLPNRFIGKCYGYFKCLYVVFWFENAFVHQNVKDFVHKNSNICILQIHLAII